MRFLAIAICTLCLLDIQIFVDVDGNCMAIRDKKSGTWYPCTEENMEDTACWENGVGQLCGANWIQVVPVGSKWIERSEG